LQVVIITGLGGSGKSTLATRLARKLETSGFNLIPVSSSKENPLNSARLLQAFGDAIRKVARKTRKVNASKADELVALAEDLNNPKISVESRLHDVVAALNEGRFLLLLDNFESNLDEDDRHILDSEISGFYQYLLDYLSGSSRAIITTRYPPSDVPVLPPKVHLESLGDFPESSFLKILHRDPEVERRSRSGELPMALLRELYKKFGGTPRFLLQIREAIKEMDAEFLKAELAKVELPTGTEPGELQKLRDKYFAVIFTERLYGYLSSESQKALCRSAVYGVPVTLEGLAAVAWEPLDRLQAFARSWQDRAFAYQETGKSKEPLWIVYGLLRGWLLARLSPEERTDAHKAAGDFLVEMNRQDRESELGLSWVDCLMESRSQYLHAKEIELARSVTDRLSGSLVISGLYDIIRTLNMELPDYAKHPTPMSWIGRTFLEQGDYALAEVWYQRSKDVATDSYVVEEAMALHGLARIDLNRGDYELAREKFKKVLKIVQQAGDRVGEASTWHALASIDMRKGEYETARENLWKSMKIKQQIGDRAGEAATWHALALIDLSKGDNGAARENLDKSLKIVQQIGDRAGEAATWHALATIDLSKGDNGAARENFDKSPKIVQQIGDRAGEAATFSQLGLLAWRQERASQALSLIALGYLIFSNIGHSDARKSFEYLHTIASELSFSQEQFDALQMEVAEAYRKDRGRSLIDAAFQA